MLQTKRSLCRLVAGTLMMGASLGAVAQDFPNKPIRIIVSFGAGSIADLVARTIGGGMTKVLGQPIIVESRTGASGLVAYEYVARQVPADGYTIALGDSSMAILPLFVKDTRIDLQRDLPPFSVVIDMRLLLVAPSSTGWNNYAEMVSHAKANPGKLNFGVFGLQTPAALGAEVIKQKNNLNYALVPYKGGAAEVRAAVLASQVELATYTTGMAAADGDKVKLLGISGERRLPAFPNVPTFTELGIGDFDGIFLTLHAPAATPRPIVDRLYSAASAALKMPEVSGPLVKLGFNPEGSTPEAAAKRMADLLKTNLEIARKAGIKPE